MYKVSAVILANGTGQRFGSSIPKPFMSLNGKPVVQHSIDVLEKYCDEVVLVCDRKYKNYKCVRGGETRADSVYRGLMACDNPKHVIIHDGVRPFINGEMIEEILFALKSGFLSVDTAVPVVDGLLYVDETNFGTPVSKKGFHLSQTPEGFDYDSILKAHQLRAEKKMEEPQDDVSLIYKIFGQRCRVVQGFSLNTKITFRQDLGYCEGVHRFMSDQMTNRTPFLQDKRVLVLGGSGGIGRECVEILKDRCRSLSYPRRKQLDLSEEFEIDFSQYDCVIHSAGEYEDESKMMDVNFNSCLSLIRQAEHQGWRGNIVFLSSTASTYGRSSLSVYSASKSALNSLIEAESKNLASKGIFINAIAPAKVNTRMQSRINPKASIDEMINPKYVAEKVLRFLDLEVYGKICYIRKGFDN